MKTIVIIGAGCSGVMVAVQLLRRFASGGMALHLIEGQAIPGRGLAYGSRDDNHVLNVPADNMSALPDESDHFVHFCQSLDPAFSPRSFVSRRIYGDYLERLLLDARAQSRAEIVIHRDLAIDLQPADGTKMQARLLLASGNVIATDRVVLACGHMTPVSPLPAALALTQDNYVVNPWSPTASDGLKANDPVLILGSGHTAIDALFSLTSHSDTRPVYLLSRRGLLPHPHRLHTLPSFPHDLPEWLNGLPATARHYLHAVKKQAEKVISKGGDWRDVIAPLRAHTPALWQRLPVIEKSRILRHLWPYWDIHRHRLAPVAHARLREMLARGQVRVIAGRLNACQQDGAHAGVDVSIDLAAKLVAYIE